MTDTIPLGQLVVRLKVPVKNMPVGTELGYKDVPDAIAALGSAAFFDVVRDQQGNPIPPLTPEEIEEAQRAAQFRAKSRRLILGADFDPLWNRVEGIPSAEELTDMQAAVDAVADVPPRVEAVETAVASVDTAVQRVAAREFPIEDFVAAAASRADAWQAAIDSALASGGKVTTRTREQTLTKGIDTKGVAIEGPGSGSAHVVFAADATPVNNAMVYAGGSLTSLGTLAANVPLHATSITLSAAPSGISAGDWLVIYNSTDFSFSPERAMYRAGEWVQVLSVSGATVTLAAPTYAAYTAGAHLTVHKLNPVRPRISGLRFTFRTGATGIQVELAANPVLDDLVLRGTDRAHIGIARSVNVVISGVDAWDNSPIGVGLNYGIIVGNSQNVTVTDCFLQTGRHGLTNGGGDVVGAVPTRNLRVRGGRITSTQNVAGCDMHGNVEYVEFLDVDMPNGLHLSGDHTRVRGGRISTKGGIPPVQIAYNVGWNHDIETTIDVRHPVAAGFGFVHVVGTGQATQPDGRLRMKLKINQGPYLAASGNTYAVYLYNVNAADSSEVDLDLDLDITSTAPRGTLNLVWIRAAEGKGFRDIDLAVRGRRVGVHVQCSPRTLTVHDCDLTEVSGTGITTTPLATPYFPETTIYSRDNRVRGTGTNGLIYRCAASGSASGLIISENDTALDAAENGTGSTTNATGMILSNATTVIRRHATVGDTRSTPKQAVADYVHTVGTFIDVAPVNVGTVTATTRSGITTTRTLEIPA